MDHRKNKNIDPWDDRVYGTGNTMPPKNHGWIIALLLIVVIFLSGIVSVLSFLNIRLFQQLEKQKQESEAYPMSFSNAQSGLSMQVSEPTLPPAKSPENRDVSICLNGSPQSVENIPQEGALSWQDIYTKNIDSVVSILCTNNSGTVSGTGVIISNKGYIITNCHVVNGAETITVQLTDERTYSGIIIGADALTDLAVVYVDASDLKSAEFGDSGVLRVGDAVAAIGDPLGIGLSGSMTNGIISAINRNVTFHGRTISLIQTNAALHPGNSGGPLINCYGQVIGINMVHTDAFEPDTSLEGLSFAIPSTTVKEIVDQLISQGYVSGRPTLGITGDSISRFDQYYFQIPPGIMITEVDPTSDAAAQGITVHDILISVDGIAVTTPEELETIIYSHEIGDSVSVLILRNGEQQMLQLTLNEDMG